MTEGAEVVIEKSQARRSAAHRVVLAVAVIALVALGSVSCASGRTSSGACEAPRIQIEPTTARPGTEVVVSGHAMLDGCNDDGVGEPPGPLRGVEILFEPEGDAAVELATTDADAAGDFSVTVTVPPDSHPGVATIIAGSTTAEAVNLQVAP